MEQLPSQSITIEIEQTQTANQFHNDWKNFESWLKSEPGLMRETSRFIISLILATFSGQLFYNSAKKYFELHKGQRFAGIVEIPPQLGAWASVFINALLTGAVSLQIVLPKMMNALYPEEFKRKNHIMFNEETPVRLKLAKGAAGGLVLSLALGSGVPLALLEEKKGIEWVIAQILIQGGIFHSWSFIDAAGKMHFLIKNTEETLSNKSLPEIKLDCKLREVQNRLIDLFARAEKALVQGGINTLQQIGEETQTLLEHTGKNLRLQPEEVFCLTVNLVLGDERPERSSWNKLSAIAGLLSALGLSGYYALTWNLLNFGTTWERILLMLATTSPFAYIVVVTANAKTDECLRAGTDLLTGQYRSVATQLWGTAFIFPLTAIFGLYTAGFISAGSVILLLHEHVKAWLQTFLQTNGVTAVLQILEAAAIFTAVLFNASPASSLTSAFSIIFFKSIFTFSKTRTEFANIDSLLKTYQAKLSELLPDASIAGILGMPDKELQRMVLTTAFKDDPQLTQTLLAEIPGALVVMRMLEEADARACLEINGFDPKLLTENKLIDPDQIFSKLEINSLLEQLDKSSDSESAQNIINRHQPLQKYPYLKAKLKACFQTPGSLTEPKDNARYIIFTEAFNRYLKYMKWTPIHQQLLSREFTNPEERMRALSLVENLVDYLKNFETCGLKNYNQLIAALKEEQTDLEFIGQLLFEEEKSGLKNKLINIVQSRTEIREKILEALEEHQAALIFKLILGGQKAYQLLKIQSKQTCLEQLPKILSHEKALLTELLEVLGQPADLEQGQDSTIHRALEILFKAARTRYYQHGISFLIEVSLKKLVLEKREFVQERAAEKEQKETASFSSSCLFPLSMWRKSASTPNKNDYIEIKENSTPTTEEEAGCGCVIS